MEHRQADTGYNPMAATHTLLDGVAYDRVLATGYGRGQFEVDFDAPTVTEIKARAAGARFFFPEAMTVLDIGGQDSKAIAMNAAGKVATFEMNDRCAAGTGKFLEIMARSLDFSPAQFGSEALQAEKGIQINSMCWVFAESEATSLVARGEDQRSKTSKCQTQGYVVWRPRSLKFSPPVGNAWICRCNCPPLANCGELHIYAADERPRPLTGTQDKERGHE